MREIKIKEINLQNYKCFEKNEVQLFKKTKISGRNKEGKSTVKDAYYDILTGKMSDGTQPDKIRPHDENGRDIDRVDIVREIHMEIDGKSVRIKKITKQKWRRPRGSEMEFLDGNETKYEVDGFPMIQKQFDDFVGEIGEPGKILMCSNSTPFLSALRKSTVDARKILENLSGFNVEDFIESHPEYQSISKITRGHSVEDTTKKLKRQLSEQKKKMDEQNTKVKYEKTRSSDKAKIEAPDLKHMKSEYIEKISALDQEEEKLDDLTKLYDSLSSEIQKLKLRRDVAINEANAENNQRRNDLERKIAELNSKKRKLSEDLRQTERSVDQLIIEIKRYSDTLNQARTDFSKWVKSKFDESKLYAIEAEEFNENSLVCPTCRQAFPEDKQLEMKEQFIQSKKRRIAEQEAERKAFNESLSLRIESITFSGNSAKQDLQSAEKRKMDAEKTMEQIKQEISEVDTEIKKLEEEYGKIPMTVQPSKTNDYEEIQKQISEKEEELSFLDNGSEKRKEIREERNFCMTEISKIDAKIQKIAADEEEKRKNLSKLEYDLREISQAAADLEKQINMVGEFSRAKNTALAEAINPYFHHFHFSFLEFTMEGNPLETCKMICNGTDYMNGLNDGDKKLCEIDLCRGFQAMNDFCFPIWVDEANTIDPWRIPQDTKQQLILISRDDGELKVEEIA